jgi:hypothetical protein
MTKPYIRKNRISLTSDVGKIGYPHVEDLYKINLKCIKDLNVNPETFKGYKKT